MIKESLKQREQRIGYHNKYNGGTMHDRFANEEFCEECENNPCTCEEEEEEE